MSTIIISLVILVVCCVTYYFYYYGKKSPPVVVAKSVKEVEEEKESSTNNSCALNMDCDEGSFCYHGNCVRKPKDWDEKLSTESNNGLMCTNRHFFYIKNKVLTKPNLWKIKECMDICSIKENYYILTDNLVYKYNENNIYEISPSEIIHKVQTDKRFSENFIPRKTYDEKHRIVQLFSFGNFLYCLTDLGKIFVLENENTNDKSQIIWSKMDYFRGRDILETEFLRVTTCVMDNDEFGLISFTEKDKTITYFDKKWDEINTVKLSNFKTNDFVEIRQFIKLRNQKHYSYSKNRIMVLTVNCGIASIYYHPIDKKKEIFLKRINGVIDACIDPLNPSIFYCLFDDGLKKYTLKKGDGFLINPGSINLKDDIFDDFIIKEEFISASGVALFTTSREIWMISNNECYRT